MGWRLDQDLKTRRTDFGQLGQRLPAVVDEPSTDVSRVVRVVATANCLRSLNRVLLLGRLSRTTHSAGSLTDPLHLKRSHNPGRERRPGSFAFALGYTTSPRLQPTDPVVIRPPVVLHSEGN